VLDNVGCEYLQVSDYAPREFERVGIGIPRRLSLHVTSVHIARKAFVNRRLLIPRTRRKRKKKKERRERKREIEYTRDESWPREHGRESRREGPPLHS